MNIDLRTLFIVLVMTDFLQAFAIFLQYLLNKTYRGIGWWVLGFTSVALGFALMFLRDFIAIDLISIILANALLVLGAVFIYIGSVRFFDKKENRGVVVTIFIVFILFYLYFTYVNNDITIRSFIVSVTLAVVSFLTAWGLFVNKTRSITASANFVFAVLLAHGCFFIFHAVVLLTVSPINSVFTPTLMQTTVFLVQLIEGILLTFGLIIMVNQCLNAEMREAEEHFELIFNTGPNASLITRMNDGLIVDINQGFTALTGFTRDETIGKSILAVNFWKDPADRQKVIDELSKKGFNENFEALFLRKNGSQLFGSMSIKTINLQGIPHIISVTRDITERKQAEEKLFETKEYLEKLIKYANAPIIVWDTSLSITRFNQAFENLSGYDASEVIGKKIDLLFSKNKIESALEHIQKTSSGERWEAVEIEIQRKDGEPRIVLWNSANILDKEKNNVIATIAQGQDITERKQMEHKLEEMATHDFLTGLPNRVLLLDRFTIAAALANRNKSRLAVLSLDLDKFKSINDTLGHDAGDQVLKIISTRLRGIIRASDTLSRVGGDEFILVMLETSHLEDTATIAQKILDSFTEPLLIDGHQLHLSTSIGIAIYPEDAEDLKTLTKKSDAAMYYCKGHGRNQFKFFGDGDVWISGDHKSAT
jgi:diguanylate cyclase (GGDEF)-like protein/PAS domain S-box-containing protein